MVLSARITYTGLIELDRDMANGEKIIKDAIQKAFKTIGWLIVKEVKQGTPVDTGRLRRSITAVFKQMFVEILAGVDYDIYVEEGTRYMKGAHMFKKAIDNLHSRLPEMLIDEIKRNL